MEDNIKKVLVDAHDEMLDIIRKQECRSERNTPMTAIMNRIRAIVQEDGEAEDKPPVKMSIEERIKKNLDGKSMEELGAIHSYLIELGRAGVLDSMQIKVRALCARTINNRIDSIIND